MTENQDETSSPFEGKRGEALTAILGPKALKELRVLLRLAAERDGPAIKAEAAPSDSEELKRAA